MSVSEFVASRTCNFLFRSARETREYARYFAVGKTNGAALRSKFRHGKMIRYADLNFFPEPIPGWARLGSRSVAFTLAESQSLGGVARESNEFEPSIIRAAPEGKPTPPSAQPERTTAPASRPRAFSGVYARARTKGPGGCDVCEEASDARADAVTVKLTNFSRWTH